MDAHRHDPCNLATHPCGTATHQHDPCNLATHQHGPCNLATHQHGTAISWADGCASWARQGCDGQIDAVHVVARDGLPSIHLVKLMKIAATISGQQIVMASEPPAQSDNYTLPPTPSGELQLKRPRDCPRDIVLETPPHGTGCLCGRLTYLRDIHGIGGKFNIDANVVCRPSADTRHIFLGPASSMTRSLALLVGTAARECSACVHAMCTTTFQHELIWRGSVAPTEPVLFADADLDYQKYKDKDDIFDKIQPGTQLIPGMIVLGPVATNVNGSRAILPVVCMRIHAHGDLMAKIDFFDEYIFVKEIAITIWLQTKTASVVRMRTVFSVRSNPALCRSAVFGSSKRVLDGRAAVMVMERLPWTLHAFVRAKPASLRVAFLLIMGLGAARAVNECLLHAGIFNCDMRIDNMGVTMCTECLAPVLGAMCCPCEHHGNQRVAVRLFDFGLTYNLGQQVPAEIIAWINKNMLELTSAIAVAMRGKEFASVLGAVTALRRDTRLYAPSSRFLQQSSGAGAILVDNTTRKTWMAKYVSIFEARVGDILAAKIGDTPVAVAIDRWCRKTDATELDFLSFSSKV